MSECKHDFMEIDMRMPVQTLIKPTRCDCGIEKFCYTVRVQCMECKEIFTINQDGNILNNFEK